MKKNTKKIIISVLAVVLTAALAVCAFFVLPVITEEKIPLEIVTQPESVTAENGYTAVFSIEAKGNKLTYLWQRR